MVNIINANAMFFKMSPLSKDSKNDNEGESRARELDKNQRDAEARARWMKEYYRDTEFEKKLEIWRMEQEIIKAKEEYKDGEGFYSYVFADSQYNN